MPGAQVTARLGLFLHSISLDVFGDVTPCSKGLRSFYALAVPY